MFTIIVCYQLLWLKHYFTTVPTTIICRRFLPPSTRPEERWKATRAKGCGSCQRAARRSNETPSRCLPNHRKRRRDFCVPYTLAYTANFTISTASTCLGTLGLGDVSASLLPSVSNTVKSTSCTSLQAFQCMCVGTSFIGSSTSTESQKKPAVVCCTPVHQDQDQGFYVSARSQLL